MYTLLAPFDTRPVKQFIKPTNCPVVGMHFIFIRTHTSPCYTVYTADTADTAIQYTVSSWVVVVRAVNLTVKLFTGSPHATQHGYYEVNTRNLVSTGHSNQCVQTQQFSSGLPFDFCHNCHFRSYGKHV